MNKQIRMSLLKLENWIIAHDYKAYDPFDGLNSYLRPLAFHNLLAERILEQIIKISPINLRPIFGIKPQISTKGIGFIVWGFLKMYLLSNDQRYKDLIFGWLNWLSKNKSPKYKDHSWANHFDHASRSGLQLKDESDIVWTGLIGQMYIEAFEIFEYDEYLEVIKSIQRWILNLPRKSHNNGICFSYSPEGQTSIHNSNMVGAAFMAKSGKLLNNKTALEIAKESMNYSCSKQLYNGSWLYGEEPKYNWVDNFHTAYNLDSLKIYTDVTGDISYSENLKKGFNFWKKNFFEDDGSPKYYHKKKYPLDSQCLAQSIDTFAFFSENYNDSINFGLKVANWAIKNMQDADGYFYYRIYPLSIKAKTPMLHWAQATMYKALAHLLLKIN